MFLWLPPGSARRFAAVLLLVSAMLGGTIDAIACEPANEAVASVMAGADQPGGREVPSGDHEGACIHGHCHHGIPHIQTLASLGKLPGYHVVAPAPTGERRLGSVIPDTLKRPPRV